MTGPGRAPTGRQSRPGQPGDGLAGRTVLVTGTAHTTARAAVQLSAAGAVPLPAAVITTVPVTGPEVDAACDGLRDGRYGWLVITSSAAWRALRRRPGFLDRMTAPTSVRVAVVGPATADAVRADDVHPLVPDEAGGAATLVAPLVAAVRAQDPDSGAAAAGEQGTDSHAGAADGDAASAGAGSPVADGSPATPRASQSPDGAAAAGAQPAARVLFACGDLAASTLTDGLRAAGLDVDVVVVYQTVPVSDPPAEAVRAWRAGAVDDVVLTSPSAVDGLLTVLGPPARAQVRIAAIGDTTAAAAAAAGLRVDVVGDASLPGLVRLLAAPPGTTRPVPPPVRLPAGLPQTRPADTRAQDEPDRPAEPDENRTRPRRETDSTRPTEGADPDENHEP